VFEFRVQSKSKKSKARAGEYETPHGKIKTPCFVPVGTKATVKGLTPQDLSEIGVQILFANTYHLHLRPGEDLVSEFGGVSKFMNWNGPARNASQSLACVAGGPTMTDSGGFQVFSLARRTTQNKSKAKASSSKVLFEHDLHGLFPKSQNQPEEDFSLVQREVQLSSALDSADLVRITEDGVKFRSHIDGSLHEFTPEVSIEIQQKLGADFILCFDECAPHPSTEQYTKEAMERTHRWVFRCLKQHQDQRSKIKVQKSKTNSGQAHSASSGLARMTGKDVILGSEVTPESYHGWPQGLYGIIQGGVYKNLRKESAEYISSLGLDAIAVGGVSVGESKKEMRDVLDWVYPYLPDNKTRHLLGIGEIDDIFDGIERGMDTFDCVIPTRFGRYGVLFVGPEEQEEKNHFRIDISRSRYAKDKGPISKDCSCFVCKDFTRAYIHHLFRSHELLAYRLASYHNLHFVVKLVDKIRDSILNDSFDEMKREWLN